MLKGFKAWKRPWDMIKLQGALFPSASTNKLITLHSISEKDKSTDYSSWHRWDWSLAKGCLIHLHTETLRETRTVSYSCKTNFVKPFVEDDFYNHYSINVVQVVRFRFMYSHYNGNTLHPPPKKKKQQQQLNINGTLQIPIPVPINNLNSPLLKVSCSPKECFCVNNQKIYVWAPLPRGGCPAKIRARAKHKNPERGGK